MKSFKSLFAILFSCLALLGLQACGDDGPFEEAGRNIDEGLEETGEAFEDTADEIDEEF